MKSRRNLALALVLLAPLALLAAVTRSRADEGPPVVAVTAKRFEFVPATLTLKKGETVRLRVTSEDVTHGLFSRAFKIDTDIEPGGAQEIEVTPEVSGTFTAICHHFCGAQHANMKMTIVVE